MLNMVFCFDLYWQEEKTTSVPEKRFDTFIKRTCSIYLLNPQYHFSVSQ